MKNVLICGADPVLLSVRAEVFAHRHFVTKIVVGIEMLGAEMMDDAPALVVLCSSLPYDARLLADEMLIEHFPEQAFITLTRGNEDESRFNGETLSIGKGPAGLLEAAERLVAEL